MSEFLAKQISLSWKGKFSSFCTEISQNFALLKRKFSRFCAEISQNFALLKRKFSSFCTKISQITQKHLLLLSQFFRWSSCGRCAWPRCSTTWTSWGWRGPATCTSWPPGHTTTSTRCSTARRPPGTASSKVMSLTSTAGPARCVGVCVKGTLSLDLWLIWAGQTTKSGLQY